MYAILAQIQPLTSPTSGVRATVNVSSTPASIYSGAAGTFWEPAITGRPKGSIDLMPLDLGGATQLATVELEVNLNKIKEVDVSAAYWPGAPLKIWRGDDLIVNDSTLEFNGIVKSVDYDLKTDSLKITGEVLSTPLQTDLLFNTFNGDGAAGGDPSFNGVLMPAGFGRVLNIPPIFFDPVNLIGMIDGYGNCQGIDWLGEGLSSYGASRGDFADYNALKAAVQNDTIGPGQWGTSIANGLIAIGAPAVYPITVHATFGSPRTGAMAQRIMTVHAGVSAAVIDASYSAIDSLANYPVHYWTATQRSCQDLIEKLAAAINATPIVTFQGKFAITLAQGGALVGSLNRFGYSEPAVTDWKVGDGIVPYWRIKGRAARPASVLTLDQVLYYDTLTDRGLYNSNTIYKEGDIVWLKNKSQWLYINGTAAAGHAPPDPSSGDSYWQNMAPAPDASVLTYTDGTAIQTLKPDEPAAQVTRTLNLSQKSLTFVLDTNGNLVGGQVPYVVKASVSKASADATASSNFSITTTGGVTATISNSGSTKGQVSITNVTSAGTVVVHAVNGNVAMDSTLSVTTQGLLANLGAVDTAHILDGSVSNSASVQSTTTYTGDGTQTLAPGNGSTQTVITFNLVLNAPANLTLIYTAKQQYNSITNGGAYPWNINLNVDGTSANLAQGAVGITDAPSCSATILSLSAGSHSITVTWSAFNSIQLLRQNLTVIAFKK